MNSLPGHLIELLGRVFFFFLMYPVFCSIKLFQGITYVHAPTHTHAHTHTTPQKKKWFIINNSNINISRKICIVLKLPTDINNNYQHFPLLQVIKRLQIIF